MRKFRIKYAVVSAAAGKLGQTMEDYVSSLATLNCGQKMCAHLGKIEAGFAIFYFD